MLFFTRRHKSEDSAPAISWRRKAWKEEALDDIEGGRAMVNQTSYKCFKGITGETPKRRSGPHMGLFLISHRDYCTVSSGWYLCVPVCLRLFGTRCLEAVGCWSD